MGAKTSKPKPPTPVETKMVTIPRIPQDIIEEILDHLATDLDFRSLRSCALVSKSLVQPCRRHLFHTTVFTSRDMNSWLKAFPVPGEGPAHYVRHLRICIGGDIRVPEEFFQHTPWFTEVRRMCVLGYGGLPPLWGPSFWKLPRFVTSLTINTDGVNLVHVRDIMVQLPNLNDLSLLGTPVAADSRKWLGIGTDLSGRFGGQLSLSSGYIGKDVVNMLLEVPSGLYFTEVKVYCTRERLLSAVRIAEACCETVVKLSHTVAFHCKSCPSPTGSSPRNTDADVIS